MSTVIRFHQHGDPSVLTVEDEAVGLPGPGQVRLQQQAIGVNYIDTMFRQGQFPLPLPGVTGVEGAGIIDAVGPGVQGWAVGDRVAYYLAPGAYAAVRLINAAVLVKLPADISLQDVAAVLTKGLTAWAGLHGFHRVAAGQTVLVQGASSSVGTFISRWAKALGANVIGTAGSAAKQAALAGQVDHVLPSGAPDLVERIRRVAPQGVDVVYEFVGQATFAATQAAVRDGGRIVNIGAASGQPRIDEAGLAARGVQVAGGPMAAHVQASQGEAVDAVFQAFREGILAPLEVTSYPLAQAAQAHRDIASRSKAGVIILVP